MPLYPQRVVERITPATTRVLSGHYESVTVEERLFDHSGEFFKDGRIEKDPVLLSSERQQGSPRPAHEPWTQQCRLDTLPRMPEGKKASAQTAKPRRRPANPTPPAQRLLPLIVVSAVSVASEIGRMTMRAARDMLHLAGRVTSPPDLTLLGTGRGVVPGDSRLPEAELNAITKARHHDAVAPPLPGRKALARSGAPSTRTTSRNRRRKSA